MTIANRPSTRSVCRIPLRAATVHNKYNFGCRHPSPRRRRRSRRSRHEKAPERWADGQQVAARDRRRASGPCCSFETDSRYIPCASRCSYGPWPLPPHAVATDAAILGFAAAAVHRESSERLLHLTVDELIAVFDRSVDRPLHFVLLTRNIGSRMSAW